MDWQNKIYFFAKKSLIFFWGVFLCLFSLVLLLSLFSFNPDDISFNTQSTKAEINNWMGSFGSHISDLLFQLIGLASFVLCLIFFNFGVKILTKNRVDFLYLKLTLIPFCLLSFCIFFTSFPNPDWWIFDSLGGVNGGFIIGKLSFIPIYIIAFLSLVLAFLTLSIIIEISFSDWIYFFRYVTAISQYIYSRLLDFILKISDYLKKKGLIKFNNIKKNPATNTQDNISHDFENSEEPEKIETKSKINKTKKIIKESKSSNYELPPKELLTIRDDKNKDIKVSKVQLEEQSKMLVKVLEDYGVLGKGLGAKLGPIITLHEFEPAPGTKSSRVIGLADDIARSMSAISTRIAVIPGKTSIGIELPNKVREMIYLRQLIESKEYRYSQDALPIILGKDISGVPTVVDLAKMPHLLIAGTTGSGKSVGVNAMILSLLYKLSPDECRFIMIDPKMLELSVYDGIPHLLSPVVTEPGKAVVALKWAVHEMEERYKAMSSLNVRNIYGYNEKIEKAIKNNETLTKKIQTGFDPQTGEPVFEVVELESKKLPFIVIIVDEMADLMMVAGKEIEGSVQRLAQMARAAGIHLIMATQRPSVDVVTGVIKANFPTRISFQVTSRIDSRTILGVQGAEQLLGQGDMIYMSGGSKLTRVHAPFCSDTEVENIVNFIKAQRVNDALEEVSFDQLQSEANIDGASAPSSDSAIDKDSDLYSQAVQIVKRDKKTSISYVQRQLRIGYNRAANLIEKMEEDGILSAPNNSGKREIIED